MARKWHELGPFTVFDLETTGMSPSRHRIVEIAAIRIDADGFQERFHTLVNPRVPIPAAASAVHTITDEMVKGSPVFRDAGHQFIDFARNSTLVAHNARFDLGFLQESLFRNGMQLWQGKTLDSIPLAKQAFPGLPSYSLGFLRQQFGLGDGTGQHHRAFTDVEWTLELLEMTLKNLLLKTEG